MIAAALGRPVSDAEMVLKSDAPPLLEGRSISFSYESHSVLEDVSLSLRPAEVVTLLGPSGCGKTTLLNLMAGFLAPTSGSLTFDGKAIAGPGPDRSVVFQSGALFEWMTARANIEFSLFCRNVPAAERRKISDQMVDLVGLSGFAERYPYELSGGMQQRVGVARVIAASPRIMLMDEPFAAVDVQTRETLQEELLRIHHSTRCTIVFVTHSIEEAVFLSSRILLLSRPRGRIVAEFAVDLPEPRWNPMNRVEPTFVEMRERIYVAMREASKQ